ncbi:hypothetical protein BDD12DRAFT_837209 [Trichophaea hybrida]|nr:hypothetical protein BDD12DRAFT_837209 [Trichophaea hybrida]
MATTISSIINDVPIIFTSESAHPGDDITTAEKPRRRKSGSYKDSFTEEPDSEERRHRHKTQERAARKAKMAAEKLALETAESRVSGSKLGRRESESAAAVSSVMMDPYTPTPHSRKHKKLEQVLGVDMETVEKERRKHRKHEKERRGDREEDVGFGARMPRKAAGILGLKNGADTTNRGLSRSPSRTRTPSHSRVSRLRPIDLSAETTAEPPPASTLHPISEARESRHRRHHRDRTTEGEEGKRRHKSRASPTETTEATEEPRRRRHKSHAHPISTALEDHPEDPKHHYRYRSKSRIRSYSRHNPPDSELAATTAGGTSSRRNSNLTDQKEDHHTKRKHHNPPDTQDESRHRHRHRDKDKDRDKKSRSKSRHPSSSETAITEDRNYRNAPIKTVPRTNGPIPVSSEPPSTAFPTSFPPEPSAQELEMSERAHAIRRAERRARKTARADDVLKDSGHSLSSDEKRLGVVGGVAERKSRTRSKSFSTPEEEEAYRRRRELKRARRQLPGEGVEEGYLSPVSEVRRHRDRDREMAGKGKGVGVEKPRTRPRRNTEPPSTLGKKEVEQQQQEAGGFSLKKAFSRLLTF